MKLIDKAAVENILRNLWQTDNGQNSEHRICYNKALQEVQCKLDTLEVKEVDLSAAVERYVEQHKSELQGYMDIRRIVRHFFELGLSYRKENKV